MYHEHALHITFMGAFARRQESIQKANAMKFAAALEGFKQRIGVLPDQKRINFALPICERPWRCRIVVPGGLHESMRSTSREDRSGASGSLIVKREPPRSGD